MPDTEQPSPATDPEIGSLAARWDEAYRLGWAPWDIGRPQPAFVNLADAGELTAPVLDCGCGTGEQAMMVAEHGLPVLGVDIAPTAIAGARRKAAERASPAEFLVGDALSLGWLGRRFATVLDCGTFHTFNDADRVRYAASLASVIEDRGVVHLLCFSELTPGEAGPRRVTQAELRDTFAGGWGWDVERIEPARFEVAESFAVERPHAWLARIRRRATA